MDPNKRIQEILQDRETPATALVTLVADRLGFDFLHWDPQTIQMEIKANFGVEMPHRNFNKLMAGVDLITTDKFYRVLDDFIRLCNALYNGTINVEEFDPADAAEISWGITEALLLWPPDPNDQAPFDDKILGYIGQAVDDEGILNPPDVLRLGTGKTGLWDQIQSQFSEDPMMFKAISDIAKSKTDEINAMVKTRLVHLLELLDSVQLRNGDSKDAVKRMLDKIQQEKKESEQLKPI
jgi:hypothetical protein